MLVLNRIRPILFAFLIAAGIFAVSPIYTHISLFDVSFAAPAYAEEAETGSSDSSGNPQSGETESENKAQLLYFKIADTGANLRSGHSTGSDVIAALLPGERVLEIKAHSGWMYVEVVSTTTRGWVWDELLIAEPNQRQTTISDDSADGSDNPDDNDATEPKENLTASGTNAPVNESTEPIPIDSSAVQIPAQGGNAIDLTKPSNDAGGSENQNKETDSLLNVTSGATAGSDLIALITAESVNLRAEPSLRSKVLAQVDTGLKVYIVDEKKPWYFVSVPKLKLKGWVFGDFVQPLDYVVITGDDVNLREKPDINSKSLRKLSKGMRFVKKAWQSDFVLVAHPDKGITGWVHQRYTKVEERKALPVFIVKGFSVNFRKEPSVVSDVYSQLDTGTKVTVLGRETKWTLVKFSGQNGWIYSEYLVTEDEWNKIGGMRGATRNLGADLISRALELRGTPYVWSGESIKGFDCSGFIYYLIGNSTGASNLPRSSADMFEQLGVPIDKEDLEPGDLVFFTTYKAGASHVGLYLGDGDFVHASSAQAEVVISNMSEGYYKERFIGAKRVPKDFFE